MIDFANVVSEARDAILCIGDDRRVVFANRAAEQVFGYSATSLVGKRWATIVQRGDELLRPARGDGTQRAVAVRPDGRTVPIELSVARHAQGGLIASVVVRDLSWSDRCLSASQLAGEREAFLAAAAHQLRAPIQPILASLRTIEAALHAGVELPVDTLPRAIRQTVRLGRLVDTILRDVVELERGEILVERTLFDLAELVGDIVEDYRMAVPSRAWVLHLPSGPLALESDRVRVHQVLVSLLDNAVKYSPRGKRIVVEVGGNNEATWVRVVDEGIGIPLAEQTHVFTKFYRASNAPEGSGLGIGLYLAAGITERLCGTLSLASEEGEGTTFVLTLPRRVAAEGRHREEVADERRAPGE